MQNDSLSFSDEALLRLPEVLELVPISRSTWWAGVRDGRFPKPVKIGDRVSAWRARDIKQLLDSFEAA